VKFPTRTFSVLFFISIAVFAIVSCRNSQPTNLPPNQITYLNHSDTARYVGMGQCKLCHQAIYNSFLETGMGKSFEHASKQKSSAKYNQHTVIYDKFLNFYYHPFWENDSLKILEFRLEGKDTVYKRVEKVDYIVGSGQHTNSHIMNTNGYLHQMPMTFYTQKGEWDFPPGFENGYNTRFSRKIGLECMSCHNTLPGFVQGSENKFETLPEGVSCERCHGPGSIHVQQRMSAQKIDTSKYIDYSIVNPGKLPIDLQFDVCQRCHLQGNTVLKEGKSFFDFRPGMKLSDYMTTFLPRYKDAEDKFIMASHADRLKQSKCFIKSFKPETDSKSLRPYKDALTCVTCHNPHVSVRNTGDEVFNNACNKCHTETKSNGMCREDAEVLKKNKMNCVSCHMPMSGSIDIPHVTVHDHYIRKPKKTKEKDDKLKTFIGLYAVNEVQPEGRVKAQAYIQQFDKFENNPAYLDSAKHYLNDATIEGMLENFETLIHLYFIKSDFDKIIGYVDKLGKDVVLNSILNKKSWSNDNAWTLYRIGEAYFSKNDLTNAYVFYKKADELAPFNPEFKNKLGVTLMAQKNTNEALLIFESILKEDSKFVSAINNLGYAYLLSGNVAKAEMCYNKALSLDPDYESLLMNIAGLNIYKKKYREAKIILNRVLKKNPKQAQAQRVLEQLKSMNAN